ncbi:MAG TPA: hypothetical protein VK923_11175 [Euzebyales bacterium]|nr:hypothetical protein [Euzebyales bacterium]
MEAAAWLLALLGSGFLVTAALTGGYLAWTGAGIGEWVVHHAGWGVLGDAIVAVPVAAGCGVLTVSFLATGSVLAPVIGHVAMHIAGMEQGVERPPRTRTATSRAVGCLR